MTGLAHNKLETPALICVELTVDEADLERANAVLALAAPFGWEEETLPTGETRLIVYSEAAEWADRFLQTITAALPEAEVNSSRAAKLDWAVAWREYFTPVECGSRFLVLGPWMRDHDAQGRAVILIEPKTAFGTGHHPSTALCLAAISDLFDQGKLRPGMRFFDLGTGSGILAIAAAKLGLSGLAVDIDCLAVDNSRENAVLNRVDSRIEVRQGSTEHVNERFDLVVANILAQPLRDMAPDLLARLKPGGCLALSGLLELQADSVEAAYLALGMPPAQRRVDGEWVGLIWG
jgi:ribosomal protein L11 methyltransferase